MHVVFSNSGAVGRGRWTEPTNYIRDYRHFQHCGSDLCRGVTLRTGVQRLNIADASHTSNLRELKPGDYIYLPRGIQYATSNAALSDNIQLVEAQVRRGAVLQDVIHSTIQSDGRTSSWRSPTRFNWKTIVRGNYSLVPIANGVGVSLGPPDRERCTFLPSSQKPIILSVQEV